MIFLFLSLSDFSLLYILSSLSLSPSRSFPFPPFFLFSFFLSSFNYSLCLSSVYFPLFRFTGRKQYYALEVMDGEKMQMCTWKSKFFFFNLSSVFFFSLFLFGDHYLRHINSCSLSLLLFIYIYVYICIHSPALCKEIMDKNIYIKPEMPIWQIQGQIIFTVTFLLRFYVSFNFLHLFFSLRSVHIYVFCTCFIATLVPHVLISKEKVIEIIFIYNDDTDFVLIMIMLIQVVLIQV